MWFCDVLPCFPRIPIFGDVHFSRCFAMNTGRVGSTWIGPGWIRRWVGMPSVNIVVDQMFQLVGGACDQLKKLGETSCSTSPPGGNQVDGLPPDSSL